MPNYFEPGLSWWGPRGRANGQSAAAYFILPFGWHTVRDGTRTGTFVYTGWKSGASVKGETLAPAWGGFVCFDVAFASHEMYSCPPLIINSSRGSPVHPRTQKGKKNRGRIILHRAKCDTRY